MRAFVPAPYTQEEKTNEKSNAQVVQFSRAHNREAGDPERGLYMPGLDENGLQILNYLQKLIPEYRVYALALAKGAKFLNSQDIGSAPLATSGKQYP